MDKETEKWNYEKVYQLVQACTSGAVISENQRAEELMEDVCINLLNLPQAEMHRALNVLCTLINRQIISGRKPIIISPYQVEAIVRGVNRGGHIRKTLSVRRKQSLP